jgi:hypothetical protein
MGVMFAPRLDVLPPPQRRLWSELAETPEGFILYGGTAIALRLGHRPSVDFDFFSFVGFVPSELAERIPYLRGGSVAKSMSNTLTVRVDRGGEILVSFFGGLRLGQVNAPEPVEGPGFGVASLIDLAGAKVAVVTQRAEARDYLDIHALLGAGIGIADMLAAGRCIYGDRFSPLLALKAIGYHGDPSLSALPSRIRRDLAAAARATDPSRLPDLHPLRPWKGT